MIETNSYKLPAFHFRVLFSGLNDLTEQDSNFESVTGIQATATENSRLPQDEKKTITAFQPVVLKRAVTVPGKSGLRQWALKCLNKQAQESLHEARIEVLNEVQLPVLVVVLKDVYVISWGLGELHAQNSNLLMEEISLGYRSVDVF